MSAFDTTISSTNIMERILLDQTIVPEFSTSADQIHSIMIIARETVPARGLGRFQIRIYQLLSSLFRRILQSPPRLHGLFGDGVLPCHGYQSSGKPPSARRLRCRSPIGGRNPWRSTTEPA
mmetsp:Transcript_2074/g.4343  ORF Transcript_2074/g.4343 Transcript_2074/m.4343 type:complete len:121 (+) Transcript_2074:923-1285(+)